MTLASHRHFREVLRPYSVSNRARLVPAYPPASSAFDVSTSLTVLSAHDLLPDCSGTPLLGFTLQGFVPLAQPRQLVATGMPS